MAKTLSQQVEAFAAAHMAEKLRMRIQAHQRNIAVICSGICPLQAESNLLGQMSRRLEERSYSDVKVVLAHWQEFSELIEATMEHMRETATLVKGFCEFYEATNGVQSEVD